MSTLETDVAVIGAGTAGLAAYRAAVAAGRRAVIIESGPQGTTCARVGCMPSKLLIAAAEAAHGIARWPEFGLVLDGALRFDGEAVMARVRRERDRFVGFVLDGMAAVPVEQRLAGHARFVDDHTLDVGGGQRVRFSCAVIATGSRPAIPPVLGGLGSRLCVNDDVFEWTTLPRSVAVVGSGVIALELGQALHRLGVRVTMFGRSARLGPFTDPAVGAYARGLFEREFALHGNADILSAHTVGDGVRIAWRGPSGDERQVDVDCVIAATGRTPNLRDLGLESTSIAVDPRGIPIFDRRTLQCGASHVFIAGDANDDAPVLHEAADDGRIAGGNAARWPEVRQGARRTPLAVVFTDPGIAIVGERHASLAPGTFVTGVASFEDQGRSRIMLRNRGLVHVYADVQSGRLRGAELIAPDAEHLAHLLAWVIQLGQTVAGVLALPFYHPVVEEGLRTALRDAAAKLGAKPARAGGAA